jgi:VCBS repeat-containing protein
MLSLRRPMLKSGNPIAGKAGRPPSAMPRPGLQLMALEPRMLFDGAGAVAAVACVPADAGHLHMPDHASHHAAPLHCVSAAADEQASAKTDPLECDNQAAPGHAPGKQVDTGKPHGADKPQSPQANDDYRGISTADIITDGHAIAGDAFGDVADSSANGPLTVRGVAAGFTRSPVQGGVGSAITGNYGTLVIRGDGSYSYTPSDAGAALQSQQRAQDQFSYTVQDNCGAASTAIITINLIGLNHPPIANDDARCITGNQRIDNGQAIRGDAFGDVADTDVDGDSLFVVGVAVGKVSGPLDQSVGDSVAGHYGSLQMGPDGSYRYTPNASAAALRPGETVQDVFSYTICDSHGPLSTATVTICIRGTNDAPHGVDGHLLANPDVRSTDQNTPITGNAVTGGTPGERADTDDNGDRIQVQGVAPGPVASSQTGHVGEGVAGQFGTLTVQPDGSYRYVPGAAAVALPAGQNVNDVFSYTINDGHGQTSTTTITIHVCGLNDAPTANPDRNTISNTAVVPATGNVIANGAPTDQRDTDTDAGDVLTLTGSHAGTGTGATNVAPGQPMTGSFGQLTIDSNGAYRYVVDNGNTAVATLASGQTLTDTFTYTIRDSGGATSTSTVMITIAGGGAADHGSGTGGTGTATGPGTGPDASGTGGTGTGGTGTGGTGTGGTGTGGTGTGGTGTGGTGGTGTTGTTGTGTTDTGTGGTGTGGTGTGGTGTGGTGTGGTGTGGTGAGGTGAGGTGTASNGPGGTGTTGSGTGGSGAGGSGTVGSGTSGTNGSGTGTTGPGGSGGNGPTAEGPSLPIVPAGFTGSALGSGASPQPRYSDISTRPASEFGLVLPADGFSPYAPQRVAGMVEEAPARANRTSSTSETAGGGPIRKGDDCIDLAKTTPKDVPHLKPKAVKASVFAKPLVEKPKNFSEQLKLARKPFRPPAKVAPDKSAQRGC